jgi:hypothetical protein
MAYFTKDIVDANGVTKKQFYKSLGCEDFATGEIVHTRKFVGEHTQAELEAIKANVIARSVPSEQELADRLEQANLQVAEIDAKLAEFA